MRRRAARTSGNGLFVVKPCRGGDVWAQTQRQQDALSGIGTSAAERTRDPSICAAPGNHLFFT